MSTIYDDRVIAASLRNWSVSDLWAKYHHWDASVKEIVRQNRDADFPTVYVYALERFEDVRQELRRRGLA